MKGGNVHRHMAAAGTKNGKCGWTRDQWGAAAMYYANNHAAGNAQLYAGGDPTAHISDNCLNQPTCLKAAQCLDSEMKKERFEEKMDELGKKISGD